MELSEDEIFQKQAEKSKHCTRNTVIPYEYEWSCFACADIVIRRKNEVMKIRQKMESLLTD